MKKLRDLKLADNLSRLASEQKLSQSTLAKKVDLQISTFHGYLNGSVPKGILGICKLANYFEISVDELLFGLDERSRESDEEVRYEIIVTSKRVKKTVLMGGSD